MANQHSVWRIKHGNGKTKKKKQAAIVSPLLVPGHGVGTPSHTRLCHRHTRTVRMLVATDA